MTTRFLIANTRIRCSKGDLREYKNNTVVASWYIFLSSGGCGMSNKDGPTESKEVSYNLEKRMQKNGRCINVTLV